MTTIIKNQIVKSLARFTKNLSPSKINLKFFKGEGELQNLELNEDFLSDLLELPPFIRLTRAVCDKISAKIHWTRLKTDPIKLFLDCVEVDMEMIENVSEDNARQNSSLNNQIPREKPSQYGFTDKVVDGMHVTINSVVVAFKTPIFRATCQLSHVSVHSTDPNWMETSLRNTRIKDKSEKEILTFRQITLGAVRVDADALYKSGREDSSSSSPLRLITSSAKVNIVIKKKIENCSVVAARLHAIFDHVLWVLTHAQLQAVAGFAKSVVQVVEKCKKSEPAPSVSSDDSFFSPYAPANKTEEYVSAVDETDQRSMSLFEKEDVKETSYRVTTGKIDIHLCDDTPIQKSVLGDGGQLGGSMQIVVNWLSLEHYPYHLALTPRTHWSSHNLASIKRAEWESELMSSYDKNSREEKIRRQKSHVKRSQNGDVGLKKTSSSSVSSVDKDFVIVSDDVLQKPAQLYECVFVISCDEFIVMPVVTNNKSTTTKTPFICSDNKSQPLPSGLPSLQFDYTLYFYPGQEDAKVPQPNLFCQLNPLHLTMDNITCIWFHRFVQSIRSGFVWAEERIAAQEAEPRHIDVRIEGYMQKLTLPCSSDPTIKYRHYRPEALQITISSFCVTNTRSDNEFTQSRLLNTLDVFMKSRLRSEAEMFPNHSNDVRPQPLMSWLNDFSVSPSFKNRYYDLTRSVVWMMKVKQCWFDFLGIKKAKGQPRPFIEPFPFKLCMCYPIAGAHSPPETVKKTVLSPLHRSPSDPYSKRSRPYRKTSSSLSTPLSSPGFAKIHKSRSAASVNIPVLPADVLDKTIEPSFPSNTIESDSEISLRNLREDMVSIDNSVVSSGLGNSGTDVCSSTLYSSERYFNSTSGVESDESEESSVDAPGFDYKENGQRNTKNALDVLVEISSVLNMKFDHYQYVFLMRLQQSFVALRDVLYTDLEKFDNQRKISQENVAEATQSSDSGIFVSVISKGAEVVMFVPAPNDDPSQNNDEIFKSNLSPSMNTSSKQFKDDCETSFSPSNNIPLVESQIMLKDNEFRTFDHSMGLDVISNDAVIIEHKKLFNSETESDDIANDLTLCNDESLLNTHRRYRDAERRISNVIIKMKSFECSVAMKDKDLAFKLLGSGCDVSDTYHETLKTRANSKVTSSIDMKNENTGSRNGPGELRLRFAMGATIDQSLEGAIENGVATLILNNLEVPLLMSSVEGVLECIQDEVEVSKPVMPLNGNFKNLQLNITSDIPPRLLSLKPSLPLNVHIDHMSVIRKGDGSIQINATEDRKQNLYRTYDGFLLMSDEMIEKLRGECNEATSKVEALQRQNLSLLSELQSFKEIKDNAEHERDCLLATVEKLTEELTKSNEEYEKMSASMSYDK